MVTVRRKSRLPASIQEELVKHFVGGATARAAALLVGVNWHTATLFFPKLREVIARRLDAEALEPLGGEVEIDESYFGGRRKGKRGAALAARSRSSGCSSVAARSMP
jgi:transposase